MMVWRTGEVKIEKNSRFWNKEGDGYYVGGIRVTGEKIIDGKIKGSRWIVSTGHRVYWYDGVLHERDVSGKVAMGMSYYVSWIKDCHLILENVVSGVRKVIGKALMWDMDTDGDGMPDGWEVEYGLDPTNKWDKYWDKDGDKLTNYEEYILGTNPRNIDTDGDGLNDYFGLRRDGL